MKWNTLFLSGSVTALMVAFGAPATAATIQECVPGKVTAASYTHDFKGEADTIFQDIQADAAQAQRHADRLQLMAPTEDYSWESHVTQLNTLKDDINDMGAKLCRLETIRRVVAPWQQAEIDRIEGQVRLMADNADDAIHFVNGHHEDTWLPVYRKYTQNLYRESRDVNRSASAAVAYANVSKKDRNLRHDLGGGFFVALSRAGAGALSASV